MQVIKNLSSIIEEREPGCLGRWPQPKPGQIDFFFYIILCLAIKFFFTLSNFIDVLFFVPEMKTRGSKPNLNYKVLANGFPLAVLRQREFKPKWKRSQLWEFEILEEKKEEVKVHWVGWSSTYDQWVNKEDIVDIPSAVEEADAYGAFIHQVKIQV